MPGCAFGYRFINQPVTVETLAPLDFPSDGCRLQLAGETLGMCVCAGARVCDFHFQPATCNQTHISLINKGFQRLQVLFQPVTKPATNFEAHAAACRASPAAAKEFPLSAEVVINNGSGKWH